MLYTHAPDLRSTMRSILAPELGNVLEWCDLAVYAFVASLIAKNFIPSADPGTTSLGTFAAFGVGFLARPLGGIVFGSGVLPAIGLLVSQRRAVFQRTHLSRAGAKDLDSMEAALTEVEPEAQQWFVAEGVDSAAQVLLRVASMRNQGQHFHARHQAMCTFAQKDTPVECATLQLEATFAVPEPAMRTLEPSGSIELDRVGAQEDHFDEGRQCVPIYDRVGLGRDADVVGPTIFEQLDATVPMLPGQVATIDAYGNIMTRKLDLRPRTDCVPSGR